MAGKVYDIDRRKRRSQHTWAGMPDGAYVLLDGLTLIDESANFDQSPFQIRDNLRYQTHYPGEVEFRLLGFFRKPRTRGDVDAYFESGLRAELGTATVVDEPLEQYMDRILGLGLLKPAPSEGALWEAKGEPIFFKAPFLQRHDKRVRSFATTVAIHLTERCNLSCLHCCVGAGPMISDKNDLTPEELSKVFTQLEESGVVTVRLTGGETMVRKDFWEILEDAASRRFSLALFTNGSRMTEEGVERLKKIRQAKGSRFSVHLSLDGGNAEAHDFLRNRKGNFDRVLNTMRLFQENGIHFFVESVLHAKSCSADDVDQVAELVRSYGVSWLSFHPADLVGNAEGQDAIKELKREDKVQLWNEVQPVIAKWKERGLEIIFKNYNYPLSEPRKKVHGPLSTKLRNNGGGTGSDEDRPWDVEFQRDLNRTRASGHNTCTAGTSQLAVGADGRVYGCPRYVGDDENVMGSVRDSSLIDIWTSSKWDWLREDFGPKLSLCQHCDYQTNCFYGKTCRANPARVFRDRYGVGAECIKEHTKLGIPTSEVTSYLHDRIAAQPDDEEFVAFCEELLAGVGAGDEGTDIR